MKGETEEPIPVLNHSQTKLRGEKRKAKPNQLNVMQETSAKISEDVKTRIKDIAQAEETGNEMEAVTELSKSLRNQDLEY